MGATTPDATPERGNLKSYSAAINYLSNNQISTLSDLEACLTIHEQNCDALKASLSAKEKHIKKLDRLVQLAGFYREGKPVYDKLNGIRWKKKRAEYAAAQERPLHFFYLAQPELKPYLTEGGTLPEKGWQEERARLQREFREEAEKLKAIHTDLKSIRQIQYAVESAQYDEQRRAQTRTRKNEIKL
ncbi:hypothetical protein SAMN05216343_11264 [Oscillibacter sp. PC13]|nr:hypothetical protein SAMN05216343_11264 [Oscillibacter sp. PC13]